MRLLAGAVALAGAALRLAEFGRLGFWNDEAWVAIATRVASLEQFLLALSVTPIAWAALLLPLAAVPVPPEIGLRLLPLAFGLATLWLAWRLGDRLAGHALGGLFALTLVAFDPSGIAWSRQLKPYTAEAALALATFLAAAAVARLGRTADVVRLALLLGAGALLSHAQLVLAPPLLVALAADALFRRDRDTLRRLLVAGLVVGVWDLTWFTLSVHPRFTPALRDFWRGHYAPLGGGAALVAFVQASYARLLWPGLGPHGVGLALGGVATLLATRAARWAALATILLVTGLVALSAARRVPLDVPRTQLFVTTLLLVLTGAAAGHVMVSLWRRRWLRPVALAAAALLVLLVARGHPSPSSERLVAEDLGPLLRVMERERRAGDRVLLYQRSLFVWGYYRTGTPVLVPLPEIANGFYVAVDDPDVVVVTRANVAEAGARAFAGARRVWFVGSRFRGADEAVMLTALARHGRMVRLERRERALLVLLEPR